MVTFCLMMRLSSSSLFELRNVMLLLYQKQFVYLCFPTCSEQRWVSWLPYLVRKNVFINLYVNLYKSD